MAKDHLQLLGQPHCYREEGAEGIIHGGRGGGGDGGGQRWLELKEKKTVKGKDLSSQRTLDSKFHTNFMASVCWIGRESFQYRHNLP